MKASRGGSRWIGALLLAGCLAACQTQPRLEPQRPRASVTRLEAAAGEQRSTGGESQLFTLSLAIGDYVEIAIDQHDIDVEAVLTDSAGERLLAVDSPTGDQGSEIVAIVADRDGEHRLMVRAFAGQPPGSYGLRLVVRRPATTSDRQRARAAALFATAEQARRRHQHEQARSLYQQAIDEWRQLDDSGRLAAAHDRLGRLALLANEPDRAAEAFQRSLELARVSGDASLAAVAQYQLGKCFQALGELEQAAWRFAAALAFEERSTSRSRLALTLYQSGLVYRQLGEAEKAIAAYDRALGLWRQLGDRRAEGDTLHNLGVLHHFLGRRQRAEDYFARALAIVRQRGDAAGEAAVLDQIGQLQAAAGDTAAALATLRRELEIRVRQGDRRGKALAFTSFALVSRRRGEPEDARRLYRQALDVFVELGDRRAEATVRRHLGDLASLLGESQPQLLAEALTIYRQLADPQGEAATLLQMAAHHRRRGELQQATDLAAASLEIYETLRRRSASLELRDASSLVLDDRYGFYVELLMERHRRQPQAGFAALAFAASERGRARSLLEMLSRGEQECGEIEPAVLAEERQLQKRLNAAQRRRWRAAGDERAVAEARRAERDLAERLHRTRARVWSCEPRARSAPAPLSAGRVQQLLGPHDLLLEVRLGQERSHLWRLDQTTLTSFELPPAAHIEAVAREAHTLLARSHRREGAGRRARVLCDLSRMLLAPVAAQLTARRLLVVADGALHYVPFAALPLPSDDACLDEPLLTRHEVVNLPSASVLAALRASGAAGGAGRVAVIADPVFSADDSRARQTAAAWRAPSDLEGAPLASPLPRMARLPFARQEAAAIVRAVPGDDVFVALDFAASKELVVSGALAADRIVHFATHGRLDESRPELSSLALSQIDGDGRRRDGWLRAHEISRLDLAAELVVLSACRTALGSELGGEGLVGLTRAFMTAGARQIVVSLWDVDDRATAELMEIFYYYLLRERWPAAAALRQAQLALWRRPERRAAAYWAGFVIQGEGFQDDGGERDGIQRDGIQTDGIQQ